MNSVEYCGRWHSFEGMIRYARMHGRPTIGPFAAMVWDLFSSQRFPAEFSTSMYRQMGYHPFSGYPLTREG